MILHMAGIRLQRSSLTPSSGVPEFSFGCSTVDVTSKRTKSVQSRHYLASGAGENKDASRFFKSPVPGNAN